MIIQKSLRSQIQKDNLEELFGERFELIERTTEAVNLSDIPSALHCFYKKYSFYFCVNN